MTDWYGCWMAAVGTAAVVRRWYAGAVDVSGCPVTAEAATAELYVGTALVGLVWATVNSGSEGFMAQAMAVRLSGDGKA